MGDHRITRLWIDGMRCLDDLEFDLSSPTVLIGPNGAGKSTILEACELLRKAAAERPFVGKLFDLHGGPPALMRSGARRLGLGVKIEAKHGVELHYQLWLQRAAAYMIVEREVATIAEPGKPERELLHRERNRYRLAQPGMEEIEHAVDEDQLAIADNIGMPELKAIRSALASIEIHTPIDVRVPWTAPTATAGPRASNVVRPALRVEQGGSNLANVYHGLRAQADWDETLERIRLALGSHIEAVTTPADPSGGRIALALRLAGLGEIPASAISDGQIAYLALLAVLRLNRPAVPSLVAFDEPDLHLHPNLIRRLTTDLEAFGRRTTVLVATHSDALLDALGDPAACAVLCELDEQLATRCVRPDRENLDRWLQTYRGLGELRNAGYESLVFSAPGSP